jgi:hypothetical protein
VDELGEMARDGEQKPEPSTGDQAHSQNTNQLTPIEIGLLGVVALVFCFIGLLAASALFDFELPMRFNLGERSGLASSPPYAGVFLYENNQFFEIQQHTGLPTTEIGFPTSTKADPMIVLWETQADRDQMKLIYETGAYIPIRGERGRDGAVIIQPDHELQPGLYCFQQLNSSEEVEGFYWCFKVNLPETSE